MLCVFFLFFSSGGIGADRDCRRVGVRLAQSIFFIHALSLSRLRITTVKAAHSNASPLLIIKYDKRSRECTVLYFHRDTRTMTVWNILFIWLMLHRIFYYSFKNRSTFSIDLMLSCAQHLFFAYTILCVYML